MEVKQGKYLGTLEQREEAYKKAKKDNIKIQMFESRLDDLYQRGITEGKEVDDILDRLYHLYSDLRWSFGLEY